MSNTDYIQVVTTIDGEEKAERIARALVEKRLAACVQTEGPISSIYWWKDQIESAREWRCVVKTRACLYGAVEREISRLHSYEVPAIQAFAVKAGSAAYLNWIETEASSSVRAE